MEAPDEEEMEQESEEIIAPQWTVYINTISNETNDVAQIIYDSKQVTNLPSGKRKNLRIPLSLEPHFGGHVFTSPAETLGKGLTLWFRPSGSLYYLHITTHDRTEIPNQVAVLATLSKKEIQSDFAAFNPFETQDMNEIETFTVERGTRGIQVAIDIHLKGNPSDLRQESEIDIIPILKS